MSEREVLIGITGGIAAYKTAVLVSKLVQEGIKVSVAMTDAACQFVGTTTLAALSGRPVATKVIDPDRFPRAPHIELAKRAELFCVAPATASFLAKAAHGHGDDLLATLYLCFAGPVLVAPAMNPDMWEKPAVRRNVQQLRDDGVTIIPPEEGWLSCGRKGPGRMAAPDFIQMQIQTTLQSIPEGPERPMN